jgi:hypothetical protein
VALELSKRWDLLMSRWLLLTPFDTVYGLFLDTFESAKKRPNSWSESEVLVGRLVDANAGGRVRLPFETASAVYFDKTTHGARTV